MANPVATLGNYIAVPADPSVTRESFTLILYDSQKFFVYGTDEWSSSYGNYDPNGKGDRHYVFKKIKDTGYTYTNSPVFITGSAWDNVQFAPSGFVTAVNSVMPKLITASRNIDNGLYAFAGKGLGGDFEWDVINTDLGAPADNDAKYRYSKPAGCRKEQFVAITPNWLASGIERWATARLQAPSAEPAGAFSLMVNVTPLTLTTKAPGTADDRTWKIQIQFGEVTLLLQESGALKVTLNSGDKSEEMANMGDASARENPQQTKSVKNAKPYVITVYRTWNGLVVASGVQNTRPTVDMSSQFVIKYKDAGILDSEWSNEFDPDAPSTREVRTISGSKSSIVSFGTNFDVTVYNCKAEMAYIPCYFTYHLSFDEWAVTQKDQAGLSDYTYKVWPIWTKNGTSSQFHPSGATTPPIQPVLTKPYMVQSSPSASPAPSTTAEYSLFPWRIEFISGKPERNAPEVFGSYYHVKEELQYPILNGNGAFNLEWASGATPADPNNPGTTSPTLAEWTPYIQNLSITIGLDGSSGSITVDKYGLAGQHAKVTQAVGAFTATMNTITGSTRGGQVFAGFAVGISDAKSEEGGSWTIPLVGMEKKLEEIKLINPPFLDGWKFNDAVNFLTKYGGIKRNYTHVSAGRRVERLSSSEDISSPFFDWRTGKSVLEAIGDVSENLNCTFVIRDGVCYFYERDDTTGLPTSPGPDRLPDYPDTKVQSVEQTPDFEDIRNEIVLVGLERGTAGSGTDIANIPLVPKVKAESQLTTPTFPWAKSLVYAIPGYVDDERMDKIYDKIKGPAKRFETSGRTTIPGDARIKPYDQWGTGADRMLIISVSHNIDFVAKTWTTDLEFASGT